VIGQPLASVIMPAYRAERFVCEAIESALAQDYGSVELIVVDDGSDDATAELAARYPITVLHQPHSGIAAARNTGVRATNGAYLAIHDADDTWPPDRLSAQIEYLEAEPDAGIVLGLAEVFTHPGEERFDQMSPLTRGRPVQGLPATMLARREVFERVGEFDETLELGEDIDWLARAMDAGVKSVTLERVVLRRRVHATNATIDTSRNRAAVMAVLRRSVHRQRARGDD